MSKERLCRACHRPTDRRGTCADCVRRLRHYEAEQARQHDLYMVRKWGLGRHAAAVEPLLVLAAARARRGR